MPCFLSAASESREEKGRRKHNAQFPSVECNSERAGLLQEQLSDMQDGIARKKRELEVLEARRHILQSKLLQQQATSKVRSKSFGSGWTCI